MTTRYPSNHAVRNHQQQRYAALSADFKFAEYEISGAPPIDVWTVVGQKGKLSPKSEQPALMADHVALLRRIAQHPADGVLAHYKALELNADKGCRIRMQLLKLNLIWLEEVHNPLKPGRPRKILHLTPAGRKFMEAYDNPKS